MAKKQTENSWESPDSVCYIGFERQKMVYIGAPHYDDSAQIHLNKEQAEWLLKQLPRAIKAAAFKKKSTE